MDPAVKRYFMDIDRQTICGVFGLTEAQLSSLVNAHCKAADEKAYNALANGKKKPDIRVLKANAELFSQC